MRTDEPGITLVTLQGNPLQDMIFAPLTHFEDGHRVLRKSVNDTINLHMAVVVGAIEELSHIKPVIYRFDGDMGMEYTNSMKVSSHWRSMDYDFEMPRPRSIFDPLARFDKW